MGCNWLNLARNVLLNGGESFIWRRKLHKSDKLSQISRAIIEIAATDVALLAVFLGN